LTNPFSPCFLFFPLCLLSDCDQYGSVQVSLDFVPSSGVAQSRAFFFHLFGHSINGVDCPFFFHHGRPPGSFSREGSWFEVVFFPFSFTRSPPSHSSRMFQPGFFPSAGVSSPKFFLGSFPTLVSSPFHSFFPFFLSLFNFLKIHVSAPFSSAVRRLCARLAVELHRSSSHSFFSPPLSNG